MHDDGCRLAPDASGARRGFRVTMLTPVVPSRVRLDVRPGVLDRGADLRFFVLEISPSGDAIASFDGTRFRVIPFARIGGGALTEPGTCTVGNDGLVLHEVARTHGEGAVLDMAEEALRARPLRGPLFVGYGRDEADALAKGTFVALPGY
jgi:hypothetical protein